MERIKLGVIGVGHLGQHHAAKYAAMSDVELMGVADVNLARAREVAERHQVRAVDDYRALLPLVDAVSIVVPTRQHFAVAKACLDHGVDVLLEKPMTVTLAEADALVAQAELCNRILQVGHVERFNPAVMAMEQYLSNPVFIEAQRLHSFNPRGADVDVVLDLMIHDLDLILSLVSSPVKSVQAVGIPVVTDTSDIASVRLVFENGCTANLTASRISKTTVRKLRIFQAKSYISLDYGKKEITVIERREGREADGMPKEAARHFCFADTDALETELKAFVWNVRRRSTPKVSGAEGRRALKMALHIVELMKNFVAEHQELLS